MKTLYAVLIAVGGLLLITSYLTLFTVHQTQQALVVQFGNPKRIITEPGLNWKIPFVQNVVVFDKRILDLDVRSQEAIASDQKRLVVDAFLRYRIIDPLKFYQTVRDQRIAGQRLSTILESALRGTLGAASFIAVVRDRREELMALITKEVDVSARQFGIEIVDVRIKRADLPEANSQAIYRRMQTERQQEAAQIRAQGEEVARRIKAQADRNVTVVKANATRDSEKLRGQGDAERNKIFNSAFGKDADFFAFYRSMQAYETGLKSSDTRLLLSPNTEFFRYFNNSAGRPR